MKTFKRRSNNTKTEMTAVTTENKAPQERELSPTEKTIQALQLETSRKINELKATGTLADLVKYFRETKVVDPQRAYTMAKVFCNYIEWTKRQDPNYVPAKRGRKKVK